MVCDGGGVVAQNNLIGISSFSPKVVSPSGSSSGLKTIRPMSTVLVILEVVTGRFARGWFTRTQVDSPDVYLSFFKPGKLKKCERQCLHMWIDNFFQWKLQTKYIWKIDVAIVAIAEVNIDRLQFLCTVSFSISNVINEINKFVQIARAFFSNRSNRIQA